MAIQLNISRLFFVVAINIVISLSSLVDGIISCGFIISLFFAESDFMGIKERMSLSAY
jgi:hypothetical protein